MAALSLGQGREELMRANSLAEEGLQLTVQGAGAIQLAFPDDKHRPAHSPQLGAGGSVAGFVAQQFRLPILDARSGQPSGGAARVHMPEAAVNKDDFCFFGKDNIRASGQIGSMEPIAEPGLVKNASNLALGLRILALDAPHVLASAVWRYVVHRLYAFRISKSWMLRQQPLEGIRCSA